MGWIGMGNQVQHYLRTVNADVDGEGKPIVSGMTASFMGAGEEFVIGEDACYYVKGRACSLAAGLGSTSYGVSVLVL